MPNMKMLRSIAVYALLVLSGTCHARITLFLDQASFEAAVSVGGTDTFDDLPAGAPIPSPFDRWAGTLPYTATAQHGLYGAAWAAGGMFLSTWEGYETITLYPKGINAIGGTFFYTDFSGNFISSVLVVRATDEAGIATYNSFIPKSGPQFVGFLSNGSIISLEIQRESGYSSIENLMLGTTPVPVPEPAGFALMISGLAVLGILSRRHRSCSEDG